MVEKWDVVCEEDFCLCYDLDMLVVLLFVVLVINDVYKYGLFEKWLIKFFLCI